MYDRHAITAELRRRGTTQSDIARKLGVTTTLVAFCVSGKRRNARVRREIARVLHTRVADLWPDQTQQEKAA
jgi:predicted transcriptional regulator